MKGGAEAQIRPPEGKRWEKRLKKEAGVMMSEIRQLDAD